MVRGCGLVDISVIIEGQNKNINEIYGNSDLDVSLSHPQSPKNPQNEQSF